jgi:hypothetical protein
MKRIIRIIFLILAIVVGVYFIFMDTASNREFRNDLIDSVSGSVESITLCEVASFEVPKSCTDVSPKEDFVRYIVRAKITNPPSHAISANKFMLKITSTDPINKKKTYCSIVNKFEGYEDLYLSRIDAGMDCSSIAFKYRSGSVKVANFLTRKMGRAQGHKVRL